MNYTYKQMLSDVINDGEYSSPRGKGIKEILNAQYLFKDPTNIIFKNKVRQTPMNYLIGELKWYFTGSNKLSDIIEYSSFWKHIANKDGTCNSAYGYRLFKDLNEHNISQWEWAYNSLIKDKDTRQAIMYIGSPKFQYESNKDLPCTSFLQFFIRKNKLHLIVNMRSNDLIKGTTFDIPFFMLLLQNMFLLLKEVYPELELGYYYHNAMSLHIYEPDFDLVEDMLKHDFDFNKIELKKPIINKHGEYDDVVLTELLNKLNENK